MLSSSGRSYLTRRSQQIAANPLPWLMLLAMALRAWAAMAPGFHHPDAIYQYLEPAHRMLSGEGVITWEWRTGIRSWLLPALLAVPLAIGETLGPNGQLPMILPRLATGAASLGIVWAGWAIGRRHSVLTATLAAFVAATWFEIVFFAAETLAEPLAVAAIIPAAALITDPRFRTINIVSAGALLGFAALARPHYVPAIATLVLVSWGSNLTPQSFDKRRWASLIGGALLAAAASAIVDIQRGLVPFAWIIENFNQNIVHNVSARYGTAPALSYVAGWIALWNWWLIPVTIGVLFGWRQCPGLLAAAAVNLIVHSLIPHKEYRFVYLTAAAITLLAALGWGTLIDLGYRRWGALSGRRVAIGIFALWGLASVTLAQGSLAPNRPGLDAEGWKTFGILRKDPAVCGVALVEPVSFADVPGAVALRRGTPISIFWSRDPASRDGNAQRTATRWRHTFNRIVTASTGAVPHVPGYRTAHCEKRGNVRMCILKRGGSCSDARRSPFLINPTMARTGY